MFIHIKTDRPKESEIESDGPRSNPSTFPLHPNGRQLSPMNIHVGFCLRIKEHIVSSMLSIQAVRSNSKLDQYTLISLPAKILSLLTKMWIKTQEQNLALDDLDDGWEDL